MRHWGRGGTLRVGLVLRAPRRAGSSCCEPLRDELRGARSGRARGRPSRGPCRPSTRERRRWPTSAGRASSAATRAIPVRSRPVRARRSSPASRLRRVKARPTNATRLHGNRRRHRRSPHPRRDRRGRRRGTADDHDDIARTADVGGQRCRHRRRGPAVPRRRVEPPRAPTDRHESRAAPRWASPPQPPADCSSLPSRTRPPLTTLTRLTRAVAQFG